MGKTECAHEKRYSKEYDAFYCVLCMEWLEKKCEDPDCEFCRDRPEEPEQNDAF